MRTPTYAGGIVTQDGPGMQGNTMFAHVHASTVIIVSNECVAQHTSLLLTDKAHALHIICFTHELLLHGLQVVHLLGNVRRIVCTNSRGGCNAETRALVGQCRHTLSVGCWCRSTVAQSPRPTQPYQTAET